MEEQEQKQERWILTEQQAQEFTALGLTVETKTVYTIPASAAKAVSEVLHRNDCQLVSSLDHLLSNRTLNALRMDGVLTVEQLFDKSRLHLIRLPNIGAESMVELEHAFTEHGHVL